MPQLHRNQTRQHNHHFVLSKKCNRYHFIQFCSLEFVALLNKNE
ncbi:unnamed protein product [Tenebrio molitor]|nr:unnamed protein product [Tenebrio molitor]